MDDEYTIQKGTVLLADKDRLVVRVEREAEQGCDGCRACAMKSLCKGRDTGQMDLPAAAPAGKTYRPGDSVTLAYKQANAAVAALIMFAPALVGLALGGWMASGRSDAVLLLGCAAGLALGLGLSWIVSRTAGALKPDVRVVSDA